MDILPPLKTCFYCQESFPMTREYFGVVRACPDGFRPRCHTCMALPKLTVEQRFWRFVVKTDGCWLWVGKRNSNGRGAFKVGGGKTVSAYRFSWTLYNGDIPSETMICHRCDNPICVKPSHLFAGTSQDNVDDKVAKGRQAKGARHGGSKLTEKCVVEIRRLHSQGLCSPEKLANKYHVSVSTVQRILARESWTCLEGGPVTLPPRAKLDEKKATEIRTLHTLGRMTRVELAAHYGVSKTTICNVINGKLWN